MSSLTRLTYLSLDTAGTLMGSLDPLALLTALQYLNVAGMCFHFGAPGLVWRAGGSGQDHRRHLFCQAGILFAIAFQIPGNVLSGSFGALGNLTSLILLFCQFNLLSGDLLPFQSLTDLIQLKLNNNVAQGMRWCSGFKRVTARMLALFGGLMDG